MEIIILVGEKYLYYGLVLLGVSFESNEEYLLFVKLIFTHITQVCVYCWQCMVARRERRKLLASNIGWLNSVSMKFEQTCL